MFLSRHLGFKTVGYFSRAQVALSAIARTIHANPPKSSYPVVGSSERQFRLCRLFLMHGCLLPNPELHRTNRGSKMAKTALS